MFMATAGREPILAYRTRRTSGEMAFVFSGIGLSLAGERGEAWEKPGAHEDDHPHDGVVRGCLVTRHIEHVETFAEQSIGVPVATEIKC